MTRPACRKIRYPSRRHAAHAIRSIQRSQRERHISIDVGLHPYLATTCGCPAGTWHIGHDPTVTRVTHRRR